MIMVAHVSETKEIPSVIVHQHSGRALNKVLDFFPGLLQGHLHLQTFVFQSLKAVVVCWTRDEVPNPTNRESGRLYA